VPLERPDADHEGEVVNLEDSCHVENVLRDAELVDFARDAVAPLHAYLEEAAEILTIGRPVRGRRRQLLGGALRHALAFSTWHSLSTNGIGRSDAAKLVTALVEGAAPQHRSEKALTKTSTADRMQA
jgi:uncharacterized protein YjlB